jgi:hypothetical protein
MGDGNLMGFMGNLRFKIRESYFLSLGISCHNGMLKKNFIATVPIHLINQARNKECVAHALSYSSKNR